MKLYQGPNHTNEKEKKSFFSCLGAHESGSTFIFTTLILEIRGVTIFKAIEST